MYKHPVKKFIILTLLYSITIVGIFFLQFRNESAFSKNIGQLRISLAETQDSDGATSLKNSLQVYFKGIAFSSDELSPARITLSNPSRSENLTLVSYEQPNPLSYKFNFVDKGGQDVSVVFSASDTTSSASLSIFAELPEDAEELSFPYKPASGFSVTEKTTTREILGSKNSLYSFSASKIDDEYFRVTPRNLGALYAVYAPSTVFSFASIDAESPIAQETTYESLLKNYKENLLSQVRDSFKTPAQLSESGVAAYVAEMLSQGKYRDAISSVPDSFKRGSRKTYLTCPFFGSIEAMVPSLSVHNETMQDMILNAIEQNSLNIFSNEDLPEYIYFEGLTESVKKLFAMPRALIDASAASEDAPKLTVAQASGILHAFIRLSELNSPSAEILSSVVDDCVSTIESSCVLQENGLSLVQNDLPVSSLVALETGAAILDFGKMSNNEELRVAGLAILNTALAQNLDLITMATAYPILSKNPHYPHYAVLYRDGSEKIWCWTASDKISFSNIEIYNMSYHGDPKFESYNTSGFFYNERVGRLYMKSRHKTEVEQIKFTYQ